jgi:hypothetical protein
MFAKQEVRCQECGTLNRVRTYSFRQIPICGNCHRSLPEDPAVKGLRSVYQWRTPLTFLVLVQVSPRAEAGRWPRAFFVDAQAGRRCP